jgi:hypothetical protein
VAVRHLSSVAILAVSISLLAVSDPAGDALAAGNPLTASQPIAVGGPAGGFDVPAGSIATFTNVVYSACNNLTWGYQLGGGSNQGVGTFAGGCHSGIGANATIGPFATDMTLRVFMTDNHCHFTYYSDGTPVDHVIVEGSNPFQLRFADSGGFCEHTTTAVTGFGGCNFCVDLAISQAPIGASGANFSAIEGNPFDVTVANFTAGDPLATPSDFAASISWGDGGTSTGTVSASGTGFAVSGGHTYSEEGSYQVTVTITEIADASNAAVAHSVATVGDASISASPACEATSLHSYNGRVATFSDAAGAYGSAADFSATIHWGDGTSTAGTISALGGGAYAVGGVHSYATLGRFTIATSIEDVGGSVASTSCTTIGFAFAPGGGSFAIGDAHAAMGDRVMFWGAQWMQNNLTGAGKDPRSFKGFARTPRTPDCGVDWMTAPGNAAAPPSGPLPTFMGVIVTSSVHNSGSAISGNTIHIVVIEVSAGYASNPGHTGTGRVVAQVC